MHLNDARIDDDNDYIYVSLITLTKIKQIM